MTNEIDTVLKAITNRLAGSLPSDTVKNLKLSASLDLSARSYPTEEPQCSTHIHGSINAITIHGKQQSDSHDDEPTESEEGEKDSQKNTNTNPSASPDPSVSFITKKWSHDTQYCMEDPEQAFVKYASSRVDEAEGFRKPAFMCIAVDMSRETQVV
nr:hypothetical protein [Tanacetum cinerariifolium]